MAGLTRTTLVKYLLVSGLTTLLAGPVLAADVTIGYQTGIEPGKVAIADADYEKATGRKINWRRFDNGAELIRAIASGDVDIGNVGSSVVATAVSRKLPVETFLIAAQLGQSEALVVRNGSGISQPADLIGKTLAVPFVSTSHYSLLSALKHWQLDASKIKIINLRVSEVAAAWTRGDIDAAYVWEPALGKIKANGKVLTSSAEVATWGAPTYDLWVARKAFASENGDFLKQFSQIALSKISAFKANPQAFAEDSANLDKIARVTGAQAEDIKVLLAGDHFPDSTEQTQLLNGPVAKAIADTAAFLKAQGKLDSVLPDYSDSVSARYLPATP